MKASTRSWGYSLALERIGEMMLDQEIVVYLKPRCGWSWGVRAVLDKYGLKYEVKDVLSDPKAYAEMVAKTRQSFAPCVEINGEMLVDVGGEELEAYLLEMGIVKFKEVSG
jgi:monothiol glutaredoxin